jgi:hypothetical protein
MVRFRTVTSGSALSEHCKRERSVRQTVSKQHLLRLSSFRSSSTSELGGVDVPEELLLPSPQAVVLPLLCMNV